MIVHTCCFTTRTRALGLSANTVRMSEQEVWGMSKTDLTVSPHQTVPKKYPGRRAIYPRRISQRIIKQYAPIAKANRQARQARRRRSPCRLSVCFARGAVFAVLHCPNRAQKQSHSIHNEIKQKTDGQDRKAKANTTEKQKQGTSKAGKRHILKRDYEKASKKGNRQAKTERANKHKQEKSPKSI